MFCWQKSKIQEVFKILCELVFQRNKNGMTGSLQRCKRRNMVPHFCHQCHNSLNLVWSGINISITTNSLKAVFNAGPLIQSKRNYSASGPFNGQYLSKFWVQKHDVRMDQDFWKLWREKSWFLLVLIVLDEFLKLINEFNWT